MHLFIIDFKITYQFIKAVHDFFFLHFTLKTQFIYIFTCFKFLPNFTSGFHYNEKSESFISTQSSKIIGKIVLKCLGLYFYFTATHEATWRWGGRADHVVVLQLDFQNYIFKRSNHIFSSISRRHSKHWLVWLQEQNFYYENDLLLQPGAKEAHLWKVQDLGTALA